MTINCPKCASTEGRSIEAIYCECTASGSEPFDLARFFRQATPPDRRHPKFWMALTALFIALSLGGLLSASTSTASFAICGLLSGVMTRDAAAFNRAVHPRLLEYWHRSFICTRCGAVYVPA